MEKLCKTQRVYCKRKDARTKFNSCKTYGQEERDKHTHTRLRWCMCVRMETFIKRFKTKIDPSITYLLRLGTIVALQWQMELKAVCFSRSSFPVFFFFSAKFWSCFKTPMLYFLWMLQFFLALLGPFSSFLPREGVRVLEAWRNCQM